MPTFERGMYVTWHDHDAPLRVVSVKEGEGIVITRHVHPWHWLERAHAAIEDFGWAWTRQRYVRRPVR